jgi:hypothetical protein
MPSLFPVALPTEQRAVFETGYMTSLSASCRPQSSPVHDIFDGTHLLQLIEHCLDVSQPLCTLYHSLSLCC